MQLGHTQVERFDAQIRWLVRHQARHGRLTINIAHGDIGINDARHVHIVQQVVQETGRQREHKIRIRSVWRDHAGGRAKAEGAHAQRIIYVLMNGYVVVQAHGHYQLIAITGNFVEVSAHIQRARSFINGVSHIHGERHGYTAQYSGNNVIQQRA